MRGGLRLGDAHLFFMSNVVRVPFSAAVRCTDDIAIRPVQMRGRACESGLPLEYLRKLASAYEDFLEDISQM